MFPELMRLEDPKERSKLYGEVSIKIMRRPAYWLVMLGTAAAMALILFVVLRFANQYLPVSGALRGGLIGGIVGGAITVVVQYFHRRPMQREIRQRLAQMAIPICISCGYDLRGQVEPRCPECGTAIVAGQE